MKQVLKPLLSHSSPASVGGQRRPMQARQGRRVPFVFVSNQSALALNHRRRVRVVWLNHGAAFRASRRLFVAVLQYFSWDARERWAAAHGPAAPRPPSRTANRDGARARLSRLMASMGAAGACRCIATRTKTLVIVSHSMWGRRVNHACQFTSMLILLSAPGSQHFFLPLPALLGQI